MQQVTITLVGTVTHGATRSFVVEVPDDVNAANLDPQVLEDLADRAQIPWNFDSAGVVLLTDCVINEDCPTGRQSPLPSISMNPDEV